MTHNGKVNGNRELLHPLNSIDALSQHSAEISVPASTNILDGVVLVVDDPSTVDVLQDEGFEAIARYDCFEYDFQGKHAVLLPMPKAYYDEYTYDLERQFSLSFPEIPYKVIWPTSRYTRQRKAPLEWLKSKDRIRRELRYLVGDEPGGEVWSRTGRFHMLSIEGILAFPPIEYLVDEMIPKGSIVVLAAPQGEGKSFWALDTALHLSRERSVVYLAAEGVPGFRQRVAAWQQYWGMPGGKFKLVLGELSLVDEDALEELLDMILDVEPELVVVDPLARVMGDGDENSARDMGRALTSVGRIQESGAAVLVLHHYGKSGGGVRGSTALPAGADVVMTLTKKTNTLTLKCIKAKDSAEFADKTYEMRVVELDSGESSCVVVPIGEASPTVPESGLKQDDWKILKAMAQEPYRNDGIGRAALIERSGVAEGSIQRLLRGLMKRGYLEQPKTRGPYYLTTVGTELIDTNNQAA